MTKMKGEEPDALGPSATLLYCESRQRPSLLRAMEKAEGQGTKEGRTHDALCYTTTAEQTSNKTTNSKSATLPFF